MFKVALVTSRIHAVEFKKSDGVRQCDTVVSLAANVRSTVSRGAAEFQ